MRHRLYRVVLLLLGLWVITASASLADGIIVPDPLPPLPGPPNPIPPRPIPYLSVKYHRVTVNIENQIATTKIDQVFINEADRDLEGTYIFPMPEEAAISDFAMWVDGKRLEGKVLDKDEARRIYEEIVRGRKDPALLEYIGRDAFRARIFPIPARGEKRVEIEYRQVLPAQAGLVRYVYPLNTEKFSPRPLQEVSVSIKIKSKDPIKAIYSPSHSMATQRRGEFEAQASYEATNVRPDKDLALYYSVTPNPFGVNLLTYNDGKEDGAFVLLVAPAAQVERSQITAKDVIFVVDTSGSMAGDKIKQARDALRFVVNNLNDADRFNIISFNSVITRLADRLQPASQRAKGLAFVDGLTATGSTNIQDALLDALKDVDRERPTTLIFLTDGLPTVGETNAQRILETVQRGVPANVRLFTFGVGYDVNTILLDSMAQQNRGSSDYVKPDENLEEAVSTFYAKVSQPVLTDLSLDFGAIRVYDTYPKPLPDLFAGGQLVLVGRYKGSGPATLTLRGKVNGQDTSHAYSLVFPASSRSDNFVPRLWATRKVGYLLTQLRLKGDNKELVDEIIVLATRYGIVTPYTSFLVDERQSPLSQAGQDAARKSLAQEAPKAAAAPSGAGAVQQSQQLDALRRAEAPVASNTVGQIKTVGAKTFLLRQGQWVDTEYREGMATTKLGMSSDELFRLIAARPDWGQYFAVGERVIVILEGVAYEVTEGSFGPVQLPPVAAIAQPTSPSQPTLTPQRPLPILPTATMQAPPPAQPTVKPAVAPPSSTDQGNVLQRFWAWLRGLVK